jgi:hypothetical protein
LALLDRMGKFVGQQALTLRACRGVLALGEIDVASSRVGVCTKRRRGFRRLLVGVNADVVEVFAEFRLHEGLGFSLQLFPGRGDLIRRYG